MVILFNSLRNYQTILQSGCTVLPHQQCMSVPISSHPFQQFFVIISLFVTILMEVKWNLTVVLICITLMANDVEDFFISIIIHLYVSFAETSFQTLFKKLFFCVFLLLNLEIFNCYWILVFLDKKVPYQIYDLQIFSHSVGCLSLS